MATANQMRARARVVMKDEGAVVITAVDFSEPGRAERFQVYFWDDGEAVMDVISKADLLENWPDEGVYVLNPAGGEADAVVPVGTWYDEANDAEYIRTAENDEPADDVGVLPSVAFMEAVEQISQLREKK